MSLIAPQDRKETQCSCILCKSMCSRSPCVPTPAEASRLIDEGFADSLALSKWTDPLTGKEYVFVAPKIADTGCVFFNDQHLCDLHDRGLKPLEGRLASHNYEDNRLRKFVSEKWCSKAGIKIMERIEPEVKKIILEAMTKTNNNATK